MYSTILANIDEQFKKSIKKWEKDDNVEDHHHAYQHQQKINQKKLLVIQKFFNYSLIGATPILS